MQTVEHDINNGHQLHWYVPYGGFWFTNTHNAHSRGETTKKIDIACRLLQINHVKKTNEIWI